MVELLRIYFIRSLRGTYPSLAFLSSLVVLLTVHSIIFVRDSSCGVIEQSDNLELSVVGLSEVDL